MIRLRLLFIGILLITSISCGLIDPNDSGEAVSSTPAPTFQIPAQDFLKKIGEDIGVTKDTDGHLHVQGEAQVRILRLITYLNTEAKTRGASRESYPYKIAGFYAASSSRSGPEQSDTFDDQVDYKIQLSFDDFGSSTDLSQLAKDLRVSLSPGGYLIPEDNDPYEKLDALLTYRNAEAAHTGDHKIKAWYETKQLEDEFLSDRVDIMVQFSFAQPLHKQTSQLAVSTRSTSATEQRRNAIIAKTAVEFAQLLKKPEELTILALDFAGDREHGPEWVYVFDQTAVKTLQGMHAGEKDRVDAGDILALAEVKSRTGRLRMSPSNTIREKEPIDEDAIEIIAYIAVETAMTLHPSKSLTFIVYDFTGRAPKKLTTWIYIFDGEAIEAIRTESLTPPEVLRKARVAEYAGIIPGNRFIPPIKAFPSEFVPTNGS